ncbi:MAG: NUDIX hydrolase [Candidatus Pacebacteria bacterium]|nr:NUDIX hydrolase [Candidatus Paceibacterota bacterium]
MENKNKRITAHLIPYKIIDGHFFIYLQKRSNDAEREPGWFTIFGGGVEGEESPETAMLREIKEELNFIPTSYSFLGKYSDNYSISHYYISEVYNDFEYEIKIGEGEYGKFFSEEEIENEHKLTENNKQIIKDLISHISMGK